jgi:cytochrome c
MNLTHRALLVITIATSANAHLGGRTNATDAAFGEYLSSECATCHRRDGENQGIPSIVGWAADQFVAVMQSYKSKDRPNVVMQTIAGRLSEQEIHALAAYYASFGTQKK